VITSWALSVGQLLLEAIQLRYYPSSVLSEQLWCCV
jgi:hypothetical protein